MSTVPETCTGETAVIEFDELTMNEAAAVPPNVTPVTPVKPVPWMLTLVPPEALPDAGETDVTAGPLCEYVNWSCCGSTAEFPVAVTTITSTFPALCPGATAVIDVGELTVKLEAKV